MRLFLLTIASLFILQLSVLASPLFERWVQEGWTTDFNKIAVAPNQILSGGPPKDGIPPIDNPKFKPVSAIDHLAGNTPVIGLEVNGDARAYPIEVMMWHEIVNDIVGGRPLAVTYCPLCNAALVFDATIDGKRHTFGTTGKLRNSDLIMYDRTTESWWQQFSGEAIAGTYTGKELTLLPVRLESWSDFKSRHPEGKVLVPNNPSLRNYGRNPYFGYDVASAPFLYNGTMPKGIEPMARVVVVRREKQPPLIMTMTSVRERGSIVKDGFQISWKKGQASALHKNAISQGRDVGTINVDQIKAGKKQPAVYDVTFAFVAHAFHPDVAIEGK